MSKCSWENGTQRSVPHKVAVNVRFVKTTTTKQRGIKPGMPVESPGEKTWGKKKKRSLRLCRNLEGFGFRGL